MTGLDAWCRTCTKARHGYRDCSTCIEGADGVPSGWEEEMGLKIEEGKYYRTRDGRKVGPMRRDMQTLFVFDCKECYPDDGGYHWIEDGSRGAYACPDCPDLIAEWTDADEPDETVAAVQEVMQAGDNRPAPSILDAVGPLLAIGTEHALFAACDVIRRELDRMKEPRK